LIGTVDTAGERRPVDQDLSVVGTVGTLVLATRGRAGAGEVVLRIRGGSETFLAWSQQPLPRGATVLVVAARAARTLDVIPWSDGSDPTLPDTPAD
jgi:hypothetical protein